ncbi:MAG: ABC transporter permease [Rhodospirillaceae bacterium]|jgi:Cu-processing system permease protein|nr:ABC transporter permease [Rhodospirillaceae bacterium]MBT4488907.1 ABC transporter permease [Rhodospirillaceae bacterium]MBT5194323.1 ABC transporter permease [Rhodospirillaceae bacterium]MBT5894382.1 ABC transporter permease [Rhodospirillaceae bacterium]MBT6429652.1 ABC transporter permease [Rhodospirillaceae bacterium]
MRAAFVIARQEFLDALRNKWVLSATLVLAGFALTLAYLGSAPVGTVGVAPLGVTVVSLSSLTVFLLPLLGLLLSYDAVVGESERGTLLLLLSYPVRRWQFLMGKFLGHLVVLTVAVVMGYGAAGLFAAWQLDNITAQEACAYGVMMASSILLGAVFVGLGYTISSFVRERATAAGMALSVWLGLVVIYDFILLGVLTKGGDFLGNGLFNGLLLANPADAYRLLNLSSFDVTANLTGMAGLASNGQATAIASLISLALWVAVPTVVAGLIFSRREP